MKKILKSNVGIMGKTALVAVLSVFLAAPNNAKAAFFRIDDTDDVNETITLSINDFEGGFFLNGNLVQQGTQNPRVITFPEANGQFTFSGSWIDLGQSVPRSETVWFLEEGGSGLLSDVLQYTYSRDDASGLARLDGSFVSFVTDQPISGIPPNVRPWQEEAGPYDFSNAFITAIADSTPVPEPSTYAAGALLLLPLAFGAFRKLRKARAA